MDISHQIGCAKMPQQQAISVIGGSKVSSQSYEIAIELGREIAKNNFVLITGGRTGVMEAASKGCQEEGGFALGILPGENKHEANQFISFAIPTGLGDARNILVVRAADGIIVIDGSFGTLSEIAFAQLLEKPLVILSSYGMLVEIFNVPPFNEISRADTPAQAVYQISTQIELGHR